MNFPRTFKCNLCTAIVAIASSQSCNVQWSFAQSYTWSTLIQFFILGCSFYFAIGEEIGCDQLILELTSFPFIAYVHFYNFYKGLLF